MRGCPASVMIKACLFAILWHVVIWCLPRSAEVPVLSVIYAVVSAFFPIIVAVNMGYQARQAQARIPGIRTDDIPRV